MYGQMSLAINYLSPHTNLCRGRFRVDETGDYETEGDAGVGIWQRIHIRAEATGNLRGVMLLVNPLVALDIIGQWASLAAVVLTAVVSTNGFLSSSVPIAPSSTTLVAGKDDASEKHNHHPKENGPTDSSSTLQQRFSHVRRPRSSRESRGFSTNWHDVTSSQLKLDNTRNVVILAVRPTLQQNGTFVSFRSAAPAVCVLRFPAYVGDVPWAPPVPRERGDAHPSPISDRTSYRTARSTDSWYDSA